MLYKGGEGAQQMNDLRKLLQMELLKLGSIGKVMIINGILFICFTMSPAMAGIAYVLFVYMWVYTPAAYDEQNKGEYLVCTLPVSRGQIVLAKYLYSLFGIVLSTVFCMVGKMLSAALQFQFFGKSSTDVVFTPEGYFLFGCAFCALIVPLILKLGVTRARYWAMGLYILGIGISSFLAYSNFSFYLELSGILLGMILLVISYWIAVCLYQKKELT